MYILNRYIPAAIPALRMGAHISNIYMYRFTYIYIYIYILYIYIYIHIYIYIYIYVYISMYTCIYTCGEPSTENGCPYLDRLVFPAHGDMYIDMYRYYRYVCI